MSVKNIAESEPLAILFFQDSENVLSEMPGYGEQPWKPRRRGAGICPICGKDLGAPSWLRRHMTTHTGQKPYRCDLCGASFTRKGTVINHKETAHGIMPPRRKSQITATVLSDQPTTARGKHSTDADDPTDT